MSTEAIRAHRRPCIDPIESLGFFRNCSVLAEFKRLGGRPSALDEFASRRGWKTLFLSLNDAPGDHGMSFGTLDSPFRGFGRAKVGFFFAAARAALDNAAIVLGAHPNLALPAVL